MGTGRWRAMTELALDWVLCESISIPLFCKGSASAEPPNHNKHAGFRPFAGGTTQDTVRRDPVRSAVQGLSDPLKRTMQVNIHQAKTHLSRLLPNVSVGERVSISRAGGACGAFGSGLTRQANAPPWESPKARFDRLLVAQAREE